MVEREHKPQTGAERPLRADAARNRELLLRTARKAFAEGGLGVRMDQIAAEAGVGTGTMYRRFADKDELLRALFQQVVEEIVGLADTALERQDDPAALEWFMTAAFEKQAGDRAVQQLMSGDPGARTTLDDEIRSRLEPKVAVLVQRAHDAGTLRRDISARDLPILQLALSTAIEASGHARPDLWRRYVALLQQALRPVAATSPLPGAPPEPKELDAILHADRQTRTTTSP